MLNNSLEQLTEFIECTTFSIRALLQKIQIRTSQMKRHKGKVLGWEGHRVATPSPCGIWSCHSPNVSIYVHQPRSFSEPLYRYFIGAWLIKPINSLSDLLPLCGGWTVSKFQPSHNIIDISGDYSLPWSYLGTTTSHLINITKPLLSENFISFKAQTRYILLYHIIMPAFIFVHVLTFTGDLYFLIQLQLTIEHAFLSPWEFPSAFLARQVCW